MQRGCGTLLSEARLFQPGLSSALEIATGVAENETNAPPLSIPFDCSEAVNRAWRICAEFSMCENLCGDGGAETCLDLL